MIELDQELGLPEGQVATITVRPAENRLPPGEGIRRSAGAWADDPRGLDHWLAEMQRSLAVRSPGTVLIQPPAPKFIQSVWMAGKQHRPRQKGLSDPSRVLRKSRMDFSIGAAKRAAKKQRRRIQYDPRHHVRSRTKVRGKFCPRRGCDAAQAPRNQHDLRLFVQWNLVTTSVCDGNIHVETRQGLNSIVLLNDFQRGERAGPPESHLRERT